jgi:maltose O-acetyltransferase
MLAGHPFCATDPELMMLRQRARRTAHELHITPPDEHLKRLRILSTLFGEIGDDPDVDGPLHVEFGRHIVAGHHLVIEPGCVLVDVGRITIGDRVRLGAGAQLQAVIRPMKPAHRARRFEQAAPITIEDDVWIGPQAVVNAGVTIGAGTVVAPGSVVMESLPAGVYAGGNPCRAVREL